MGNGLFSCLQSISKFLTVLFDICTSDQLYVEMGVYPLKSLFDIN